MRAALLAFVFLMLTAPAHGQLWPFVSVDRINQKLCGQVIDYTANHGQDHRIFSRVLNQPRDMYVYLPPGYDSKKIYPVLYYFHFSRVDERQFIGSGAIQELDRMIVAGVFPPTVVVCPDGTISGRNRLFEEHSFYINSNSGRFEDFLLTEVIPFINGRYSIRPERQAHGIIGLSSGGFGAMSIAIRHREYFGVVATLAAPVNMLYNTCHHNILENFHPETFRWKTQYNPDEVVGRFYLGLRKKRPKKYIEPLMGDQSEEVIARLSALNPANLLLSSGLQPGELAIYVHYPGKDGYNFDAQNQSFAWLASQKGIAVTQEEAPKANHNLRYFKRNHMPAYEWLGQHLLGPTSR